MSPHKRGRDKVGVRGTGVSGQGFGRGWGSGAEGSGQRQHVHLFRPGFQQDSGTFLHCRSGGEHIVDKQDMFIGDYLGSANFESPADILLSFRAGKLGLGLGMADTLESRKIQGNKMPATDTAGQEQRLIESPLPEAPGVKRDG